ncbi:choloylglycine hydrolase family Linear amide C-N hydrolase [Anopheles sinensis]|uniref:Choloylglycine hydrolase family Linear amide C-N hydrolase n=1 Tax=Anopheles sinensis TaxID=74873 RepID=A0A084W201_ANOSI|nr:choloylglycine hydrolase family Linear amide C-N hydrolase [Anopheles sinensis]
MRATRLRHGREKGEARVVGDPPGMQRGSFGSDRGLRFSGLPPLHVRRSLRPSSRRDGFLYTSQVKEMTIEREQIVAKGVGGQPNGQQLIGTLTCESREAKRVL